MSILTRHKEERKRQKITLKEMAGRLGITPKTLYFYEKGERQISFSLYKKYLNELGYLLIFTRKEDNL